MAVRIPEVKEAGQAGAEMPGRAELHLVTEARAHEQVGRIHQALRIRHGVGDVVQARTLAAGEHHVVRVSLALQKHHHELVGVVDDVLGQSETDRAVEIETGLHVRRDYLDVVQALRAGALVDFQVMEQAWPGFHGSAELERRAGRIGRLQRAALMRHVDPCRAKTRLREACLRKL